jgi:uncharacterized membrane protein
MGAGIAILPYRAAARGGIVACAVPNDVNSDSATKATTTISAKAPAAGAVSAILGGGRAIFAFAIIALGVENVVCAHGFAFLYYRSSHPWHVALPNFPYLPAIPALAYLFGVVLAACGAGMLRRRARLLAAMVVAGLFFLCTVVIEAPKYAAIPGDMSLRTRLFEPLAIATLACLLPGRNPIPPFLERASRYLLAVSLIVFRVDHFLALAPIGTLIPNWIPWHVFWIAFFGAVFIAAGVSIGLNILRQWGAAGLGLMFAIWVITLHMPRAFLGLYGGHPRNPEEWASLFIAIALWGGSWALAESRRRKAAGRNGTLLVDF